MKRTIYVEATFQIVAAIKGQKLAYPQTLVLPVELSGPELEQPYGLEAFKTALFFKVDAAIAAEGSKAFIHRLKTDTATKRKVGGTKWKPECVQGIEVQPLYLKE